MNNVYLGILVVITCSAGYYISFRKQWEGNYAFAIAMLMLCGLILRIYTASDSVLHFWDERYHALVAKNLLHHFFTPTLYDNPVLPYSYKSWEYNHIWVHKQPVTLWLIAISLKIFGIHAWAVRVPSVLLSTIGIKLMYDIGKRLYTAQAGYVSAFLFSIHGLIIELASGRVATDHVDVAFMFFVLMAVWCCVQNIHKKQFIWSVLAGICMGAAVLCKWLPALIVMPVGLLILLKERKSMSDIVRHSALIILAAVILVIPWQWYILHRFPMEAAWEYEFNLMHFKEVLADQGGGIFYHFNMLRMNYGELVYLPVIWFSYIAIKKRDLYDLALAFWFWIPYVFFSFSATKMQAYTLFAAPAVFIIIARFFYMLKENSSSVAQGKWIYLVPAYALILLPVRYTIERVKPFTVKEGTPPWFLAIREFKQTKSNDANTVIFNCSHPLEMMFETSCICYPGYDAVPIPPGEMDLHIDSVNRQVLPDATVIKKLQEQGYKTLKEQRNGSGVFFTAL
jgi:4-amino-4-deoxy-L-arabinose transferase-like glycosyltransferase